MTQNPVEGKFLVPYAVLVPAMSERHAIVILMNVYYQMLSYIQEEPPYNWVSTQTGLLHNTGPVDKCDCCGTRWSVEEVDLDEFCMELDKVGHWPSVLLWPWLNGLTRELTSFSSAMTEATALVTAWQRYIEQPKVEASVIVDYFYQGLTQEERDAAGFYIESTHHEDYCDGNPCECNPYEDEEEDDDS